MATRRTTKSIIGRLLDPVQWGGTSWGGGPATATWGLSNAVNFSSYLQIYRNSDAVRMVISYRAETAAIVPWKVYRNSKQDDRDVTEALDDHALKIVIDGANPELVEFTFIRDLWTDLDIFDVTYWKKRRVAGQLLLLRQYPDAVTPNHPWYPTEFKVQQADGTIDTVSRDNMLWIRGYGGGVSPLEALKQELEADLDERRYRQSSAKTGWRNAGVIRRPKSAGKWTENGRNRFLKQMESRYSGNGDMVGRPLLLEEDMEWQNDSSSSAESDYVAARTFTTSKACWAYHMDPRLLGIEGAPYAAQLELKRQLFQIVLAPGLKHIEQEANKQVLPDLPDTEGVYSEFNINGMLRGDPATQTDIGRVAVGGPWYTPNEWREQVLNMGPVEGGDVLLTGKANPQGQGDGGDNPAVVAGPIRNPRPSDQSTLSEEVEQRIVKRIDDLLESFKAEAPTQEADDVLKRFSDQWDSLFKKFKASGSVAKKDLAGTYQLQAMEMSTESGSELLEKMGLEYDIARTVNYWIKTSSKHADGLFQSLSEGPPSVAPKVLAQTIITQATAWGKLEALQQNELKAVKVWRISEANSRHKQLDGMKRNIDEKFPNGILYPAQPAGPDYEVWGCKCTLDIEGVE